MDDGRVPPAGCAASRSFRSTTDPLLEQVPVFWQTFPPSLPRPGFRRSPLPPSVVPVIVILRHAFFPAIRAEIPLPGFGRAHRRQIGSAAMEAHHEGFHFRYPQTQLEREVREQRTTGIREPGSRALGLCARPGNPGTDPASPRSVFSRRAVITWFCSFFLAAK